MSFMKQYFNAEHYTEFRSGSPSVSVETYTCEDTLAQAKPEWSFKFRAFKTIFDYGSAILVLPLIGVIAFVLLALNPLLNPGPIFFKQKRVGQNRRKFNMWKFRTMLPAEAEVRNPGDALEENRITKLGRILRKSRIDELPNFFNVLKGEMSVIGPRPDADSHATYYADLIFGYDNRHQVKPGITGLAQVEQGYVDATDAVTLKAKYDNIYVSRSCGRLDIYIILRTIRVMINGFGAK